jgi:hypothetical protein
VRPKTGAGPAWAKVPINGGVAARGCTPSSLQLDGAEVTRVDNTKKLAPMRSLGADHIIDYTRPAMTTISRSPKPGAIAG